MIRLVVGDIFTRVVGEDWEAQKILYETLSYKVKGAEHIARKRGIQWDGIQSYYNTQNFHFLTGFTPRVVAALHAANVQYEIADERNNPVGRLGDHTLHGTTLRDYQEKTLQDMLEQKRGIVHLATGSGKTEVSAAATKALGVPTIFLTHRVNLMRQSHRRYLSRLPEFADQFGLIGDGVYEPGKITFAMVQTIQRMGKNPKKARQINDELAKYQCLFIDEAHRAGASYFWRAANACHNAHFRFGLTATPFMHDDQEANLMLEGITGPIIAKVTATELIERGYLARPLFKFYYIDEPKSLKRLRNWRDIYEQGIIGNAYRNRVIIDQTKTLIGMGKKALVIVVEKEHGRTLLEMFTDAGVNAQYVDGEDNTGEREEAIAALASGKRDCIICTNIFDEGVDTDCIGAVVLAGGTKSAPALFQRTGRAMRPKEEQNYCVIIDFIDRFHHKLEEHSMRRYRLVQQEEGFRII